MSMPLIAILRGVKPAEVVDIAEAVIAAGITQIEVPMNSPEPLMSIRRLSEYCAANHPEIVVGAGTVVSVSQVNDVCNAGGRLIVSPNCNVDVIQETRRMGLISIPGVATPTEALAALDAGACGLKLFPAVQVGTNGMKALLAVLPPETKLYAVGGVDADQFAEWRQAGAYGVGIGSTLYQPGLTPEEVADRARYLVKAWQTAAP